MKECCNDDTNTCGAEADCCEQTLNIPCPVEMAVSKNTKAFFAAMQAVQVDIFKEKIRAEWGSMMEKEANAVLEAMDTHWAALLSQAKAQCDLREKMKNVLTDQMKS